MQRLAYQLHKEDNGFTLVELIVVLVILAILAAILIPTLIGYIKQAREQRYYSVAETVREAAQSVALDQYAHGFEYKYGRRSNEYSIDVNDMNSQGQTVFDVAGVVDGHGSNGHGPNKVSGLYFNIDSQGQIINGNVEFIGDDFWYRYNLGTDGRWSVDDRTWDMKNK